MGSTYKPDRHERRILALLQENGRLSHAELGRRLGLSPTAVADRVRELEAAGVIRGYTAVVDPRRLGLAVTAIVTMACDGEHCRSIGPEMERIPEVVECHRVTGDASAVLKVVVPSVEALEALLDRLTAFGKPSTAVVLSTPVAARALPIGDGDGGAIRQPPHAPGVDAQGAARVRDIESGP